MRENFWKTAAKEVGLSAALATVFCLLAEALLAVFVRAYALSEATIIVSNLVLKTAAAFVFPLLAVRGERALFKGMAAGFLFLLLTTLLFGLIGGFRFSPCSRAAAGRRSAGNCGKNKKKVAKFLAIRYNREKITSGDDTMIKTIARPQERKVTGCGECRSTCQSACKTSCTVGNQSCERVTRESKIEKR